MERDQSQEKIDLLKLQLQFAFHFQAWLVSGLVAGLKFGSSLPILQKKPLNISNSDQAQEPDRGGKNFRVHILILTG